MTRGKKNVHPYQEWHRKPGAQAPEPIGRMMPGENLREKMASELMAGLLSNPGVIAKTTGGGYIDYTNAKTALGQVAWMAVVGADMLIEYLNYEPGPLRNRGEGEEKEVADGSD